MSKVDYKLLLEELIQVGYEFADRIEMADYFKHHDKIISFKAQLDHYKKEADNDQKRA